MASRQQRLLRDRSDVDSTGVVTVSRHRLDVDNGDLYVANSGNGTLNITGGGVVNTDYCEIGSDVDSKGASRSPGIGSTWNNGDLYVG